MTSELALCCRYIMMVSFLVLYFLFEPNGIYFSFLMGSLLGGDWFGARKRLFLDLLRKINYRLLFPAKL